MKFLGRRARTVVLALLACGPVPAPAAKADPIGKVIELLDALTSKIQVNAGEADKAYREYYEWCDETAANKANAIKQLKAKKEELEATITKSESDAEASEGKISDLAEKLNRDSQDLEAATALRDKELAQFKEAEAELMEADDALGRAIGILEKEMEKNPAAFAQVEKVDTSSLASILAALGAVVDAAGLPGDSKAKLVALVQSQQGDDEEASGAPDPTSYESHSAGVVDVLEDMKEKAQSQLKDLRRSETNQAHSYELLKQGNEDTAAADKKAMTDEKQFLAETKEAASVAQKELVLTSKALEETEAALSAVQQDCMRTASDHEASVDGRDSELKVIAEARKALVESTSASLLQREEQQPASLLQTASSARGSMLRATSKHPKERVARLVKRLAEEHHSTALAQLASRITAMERFGVASGEDPFSKIKGMISDMIVKLQREAKEAADEKQYCDEQMAKTQEKKDELEGDEAKLTAAIDMKVAQSADLKKQVTETQAQMAKLAQEQVDADKIRKDANAAYKKYKTELETGLYGVKKALKILRKYYGSSEDASLLQAGDDQPAKPVMHTKALGAGGSIMDILEVVEADLAKNLAAVEQEENDEVEAYEKVTQEIKVQLASKGKDVQYKVQEFKSLDQAVNEQSEARDSTQQELDAVLEYYAKVKERCIAKPEAYEKRAARRAAEIKGLKDALQVLSEEVALLQSSGRARAGRGTGTLLSVDQR